MRYGILIFLGAASWAAAADLPSGPASAQLQAASQASSGGSYESSAEMGSRWSDGAVPAVAAAPMLVADASSDDKEPTVADYLKPEPPQTVVPPSPAQDAKDQEGFMKGFVVAFTGVEWVPNLISNSVPVAGKFVGGLLGILLLPVGIVAGAVAGAGYWIAGRF